MHMLIYALVETSTSDDVLTAERSVFDRLVGIPPHADAVSNYDEFRQDIRNRECLKQILSGEQTCWIVPADVHY